MNCLMPTRIDRSRAARTALVAGVVAIGLAACAGNSQVTQPAASPPAAPVAAAAPAAKPMAGMEGMAGMDHSKMEGMDHSHMMSPAQMAELREKVPLYAVSSDEQIMENMGRMPPDFWNMISPGDMRGAVGVLALGHGYKLGGNEQFENYAGPTGY